LSADFETGRASYESAAVGVQNRRRACAWTGIDDVHGVNRRAILTVYLSPMIDCFDGLVVSWSISTRPDAELVNTMLDAAIQTVTNGSERPVVHSDRGGHYRWPGWLSRIAEAQLARSMSRKACSPDNAACEGFFGRLKNEFFYSRDWLSTTIEEFVGALDTYVRWYNEVRVKISLGCCSPVEYRNRLGIAA
jgi:putative transposase